LPDFAGQWRDYLRFHLHGFEYAQAVSDRNRVPGLDGKRDYNGGHGGVYDASIIAIHPVSHTFHFNPGVRSVGYRDDVIAVPEDGEPTLILAEAVDVGCDSRIANFNPIVSGTEAMSLHGVELAAMAERASAPDLTSHLWPAACGG